MSSSESSKETLKSILDKIQKPEFSSIVAFKLVQYGIVSVAAVFAEKLFSNTYMQTVYAGNPEGTSKNNGSPPPLADMLGTFIGLNLAMTVFLLVLLWVVCLLFGSEKGTEQDNFFDYRIRGRLPAIILDYVAFMVTLVVVCAVLVGLMQKKVYFRYQTDGLRVIQSLKEVILSLAALFILVPYGYLFSLVDLKVESIDIDSIKQGFDDGEEKAKEKEAVVVAAAHQK